ncbi:hypothetical protein HK096_006423 [Nowakowskiella sp. JEL0078]|nr:hypothetical protein HK096_006423 [Nowakowskiella sp. JEL0078]
MASAVSPGPLHATFVAVADKFVCSLTLADVAADSGSDISGKRIFICLDISGSMSGSPITNAKSAILDLIFNLRALNIKNITVVFWNNFIDAFPTLDLDDDAIKNKFANTKAYGGTSFLNCLKWLITNSASINDVDVTSLSILFFTDGQDTSNAFKDK